MSLASVLAIVNLVLVVGGVVGGYIVMRSAIARTESDVQTRVREALHDENELLQARVMRVERENKRLQDLIQLLIEMLKKTQQIDLDIDGEIITLRSPSGTHISRIPQSGAQP